MSGSAASEESEESLDSLSLVDPVESELGSGPLLLDSSATAEASEWRSDAAAERLEAEVGEEAAASEEEPAASDSVQAPAPVAEEEEDDDSDEELSPALDEKLPFGELAILEEMISREQLNTLLYQQADRRETEHKNVRIGTLLVREGLLTKRQAKRLLKIQRQDGPIDGFVLLEHLGSGGMGSVFRAVEESSGRELAVKILPPRASRDLRYRTRFLREAKLLQQLDHPHLVRCYSHGECNGHLYFAMELVRGVTGRALLKRDGAMKEPRLRVVMRQCLEAMVHYWRELIVHRDIKPDNLLFDEEGDVKLADLGLSRQLDDGVHITTVGKTLGTPLYISPEMARGRQDIDVRADLYSLGATFYHFATGVPPFDGASQAELLKRHVEDTPVRPRLKNSRLSEGMERLLLVLLEKSPTDRFAGPSDALAALDRLEAGEDPAPGYSAGASTPNPPRKRGRTGSSAERNLRGERARRGRLNSSGARTGYRVKERKRPSGQLLAAAGLAFLGLFGLGVLLGANRSEPGAQPGRTSAAAASEPDVFELARRDPEAAAAAALKWCERHPDRLAEQVARLEAADKALPESSQQRHALRLRLLQARELLLEEGDAAVEKLRNRLISLVESGKLDEAQQALEAFPVAYRRDRVKEAFEELQRELEAVTHTELSSR
ncbi:MAG TPA: hypothetical protein DEA08_17065 [Planctomycetes bacterium]|nr:hypothetical protein [Planctomycetota bacterium]